METRGGSEETSAETSVRTSAETSEEHMKRKAVTRERGDKPRSPSDKIRAMKHKHGD